MRCEGLSTASLQNLHLSFVDMRVIHLWLDLGPGQLRWLFHHQSPACRSWTNWEMLFYQYNFFSALVGIFLLSCGQSDMLVLETIDFSFELSLSCIRWGATWVNTKMSLEHVGQWIEWWLLCFLSLGMFSVCIFRSHQKSQLHEILAQGVIWGWLEHDEAWFSKFWFLRGAPHMVQC